jgi:minor histocompatibility antigen H13
MSWQRNPAGDFRSTNFEKPYFTACMVAYVAGLATTMGVMHFFNAAQPALLYLSPACIISSLITAAVRGEIKDLFAYTTEEEEEEKKKKKDLIEEKEITINEKRTTVTESIETETETIELEQIDGDDEEEDEEEAETTGRSKGSQAKKRRNKKK